METTVLEMLDPGLDDSIIVRQSEDETPKSDGSVSQNGANADQLHVYSLRRS